jgi:hypothetical protein
MRKKYEMRVNNDALWRTHASHVLALQSGKPVGRSPFTQNNDICAWFIERVQKFEKTKAGRRMNFMYTTQGAGDIWAVPSLADPTRHPLGLFMMTLQSPKMVMYVFPKERQGKVYGDHLSFGYQASAKKPNIIHVREYIPSDIGNNIGVALRVDCNFKRDVIVSGAEAFTLLGTLARTAWDVLQLSHTLLSPVSGGSGAGYARTPAPKRSVSQRAQAEIPAHLQTYWDKVQTQLRRLDMARMLIVCVRKSPTEIHVSTYAEDDWHLGGGDATPSPTFILRARHGQQSLRMPRLAAISGKLAKQLSRFSSRENVEDFAGYE